MFEEIFGLPVHPLVTHATVVLTPMLAAAAATYALVPGQRPRLRWLLATLAVAAPACAWITEQSGIRFETVVFGPQGAQDELAAMVRAHQDNGTRAMWAALALGVTGLLLAAPAPDGRPRPGPADGQDRTSWWPAGGPGRAGRWPVPGRGVRAGASGSAGVGLRERHPREHAAAPTRPGGLLSGERLAVAARAWDAPLTGLAALLVVATMIYTVLLVTGAAAAGHVLLWLTLGFAAVVGVRHYLGLPGAVSRELTAQALVVALATTWYVVAAGHSGAQAVWKPQDAAAVSLDAGRPPLAPAAVAGLDTDPTTPAFAARPAGPAGRTAGAAEPAGVAR